MDDKRLIRNIKKQIKKDGNRKRRRYYKNLNNESGDFDFGSNSSKPLNGYDKKRD